MLLIKNLSVLELISHDFEFKYQIILIKHQICYWKKWNFDSVTENSNY